MNTSLFDWIPPPDAPADKLAAAYAHACRSGLPVIGSAAMKRGSVVIPVLILETQAYPHISRFLADVALRGGLGDVPEEQARTSLHLLAPPNVPPIIVVAVTPPDIAPDCGFWCVLDLSNGVHQAAATAAGRDGFIAVGDQDPDRDGNLPALLMLVEGRLEAAPVDLLTRALPALVQPARSSSLPSAVARVIQEAPPDMPPPRRVVYAESSLGRIVVYLNPRALPERLSGPHPYFWTTQIRDTMEQPRLSKGWQAISLQMLRSRAPGHATLAIETILAWAPGSSPWKALMDAVAHPRISLPFDVRMNIYFLAQTAGLDEAARLGWLPMLNVLLQHLPNLPAYPDLPEAETEFFPALARAARDLWSKNVADVIDQILAGLSTETFRSLNALAASWRWTGTPPTPHPANLDLIPAQMMAIALCQHLVLHGSGAPPPPPLVQPWRGDDLVDIWWSRKSPDVPLGSEALAVLHDAVMEILQEIDTAAVLVGTFAPRLPWRVPALQKLGVDAIWVHACAGGWRWVRLVPEGGRGGLILPWRPDTTPPRVWDLVLRSRARAEIHLFLLGFERDMRREGYQRVMFQAREERPPPPLHATRGGGGRKAIQAPRGRTEVVHLSPTVITGEYVHPDERTVIARRVADLHRVRQHIVRYSKGRRASPAQLALWNRLTRTQRRYYFKRADLAPNETLRGLREGPAGQIMFGYQRGKEDSSRAPTPVVAQGALNVAMAIRLMEEAEAEAARATAALATLAPTEQAASPALDEEPGTQFPGSSY